MLRALFLIVMLLPALATAQEPRAKVALYVEADGWAHAEPVSIKAYADDWDRSLGHGSDGLAWLQFETGARLDRWRIGWVVQRQYVIDASRGAARLQHLEKNELPSPPDERYDVKVRANYYTARGLRVGRELPELRAGGLAITLTPSLVYWKSRDFEDGDLDGLATSDDQGDLSYAADLDHFYSEDLLLDRKVARPDGRGASLDLQGQWRFGERLSGRFDTRNLLGRMWWKNAPYTLGVLDSDTRQVDDNGAVHFDPTLRGFEGKQSHRQRMPLFVQASTEYAFGAVGAGASVVHTDIGTFPGARLAFRRGDWSVASEWLPTARDAICLEAGWRAARLRVGSNARDWKRAETLLVQLAFEIPLDRLWPPR